VHGNVLRARLSVEVSAITAVPLPGDSAQWQPERVLVDGKPAQGLLRVDGQLWLRLTPGAHDVSVEGALPSRESLQIALPMKPLCKDDCKGLCPNCGTNLNKATCDCTTHWEDPRLAALRALKKES